MLSLLLLGSLSPLNILSSLLNQAEPVVEDLAKALFEAISQGRWDLVAALVVVLIVLVVRRFGPSKIPFLRTDAGGVILVLATALSGAVASALAAGQVFSLALLYTAFKIAAAAAGGYSMIKKLVWPLILKLFGTKKPLEHVAAEATAAGDAAVKSGQLKSVEDIIRGK